PRTGDLLLDNDFPPDVDLRFLASGGFDLVTASVDGGEEQLVDPASGSYHLQMAGGRHQVTLSGWAGDQRLARTVDFQVGARNLRAGRSAIQYQYSGCDDALSCDAAVS